MAEILVVEDYPPMASMLARVLRTRGYRVERELTVAGAMRKNTGYQCAVLDIDLPDGNGVALAEYLLTQQLVHQVIFFTATREASTLSRAAQLGPVVDKTQGIEQLVVAVERLAPAMPASRVDVASPAGQSIGRTSEDLAKQLNEQPLYAVQAL